MANLGSLVVTLEANISKFLSDMQKSSKGTEDAMKRVEGAVEIGKKALEFVGIGVTVGAFAELIKGAIDAADELRDMSQKTGVAVETLNGLGFAAGQAGGNLESIAAAAGKVNKSVAEAAGGNKDMSEAYAKLGISVRDASGQLKTADIVIAEVADKFKDYADGPEKTAIALRIFGKAGADMIPLLNDGGDALRENIAYAKQYSGVTEELAGASDNFNDTMGKLTVQQKGLYNAIASAVLPVLQAVGDEMLAAAEDSDKFSLASETVRTTLEALVVTGSEVAFTLKSIGREIGGMFAQADALGISLADMAGGPAKIAAALLKASTTGNLSFSRFSAISDAVTKDAEKARQEHDAFVAKVLDRTHKPAAPAANGGDPNKPKPRAPTIRANGDDPSKAFLDGQLKVIEAAYAQERDTTAYHDQFMQELRNQDLIDVQTYAQYKTASIEQARDAAVRAYDAEIAALEKARAAAGKDADKTAITNQINEKVAQRDKARADATRALALQTLSLSAAQSDLDKQMREWNIQQDQAASQLQFNNDLYGKSALEISKLTEARRLELEIEEKIRLAKEKGTITEESIARYRKDAADHAAAFNKAATQSNFNQVKDGLRDPGEVEQAAHENILRDLQAFKAEELAHEAEGNRLIELETERHERAKFEMKSQTEQAVLSMMSSSTGQLYDLLKQAGLEQSALGKAAFLASKALAVAQIILNTNVAAAAALAPPPIGLGPVAGVGLAAVIKGMGYASAGMTAGLAIAEASARNGYDIPAGVNPVTQLHEQEMVLPKPQADVIRDLAARGGAGAGPAITYAPVIQIDSRTDQAQVRQLVSNAVQQGNADLVERLQRAGRI